MTRSAHRRPGCGVGRRRGFRGIGGGSAPAWSPLDLTNLRVLPNGDRQITRADSKAAGQTIPGRFFDTQEGVRFFGGTPTNQYDILHGAK